VAAASNLRAAGTRMKDFSFIVLGDSKGSVLRSGMN
jgi:hypothetical protein